MFRKTLFGLIISTSLIGLACSGGNETANSNTANANSIANGVVITNPANMPEGLSTKPVEPSGNATPGIPDPKTVNANAKPANVAGISDANGMVKQLPKGATPTPGIPSPDQIKKQMSEKHDISEVNDPKKAAELVKQGLGNGDPSKKKQPAGANTNTNVKPQ